MLSRLQLYLNLRYVRFFLENRKNITVNLGIFASYLSKEKSSAHRFSPGARFILL